MAAEIVTPQPPTASNRPDFRASLEETLEAILLLRSNIWTTKSLQWLVRDKVANKPRVV